ncbi:deoxyguanosinetriphosphate triphosphohydrolase [Corynebacterium caspium]|uniref:deoxyguanosinetriphosphate triphosphohydrolase n=1 Tax=Corynebacterium caspium TaxID=234828 RepID=UPI00035E19AE|nr:deoxyguanosinetriphosphate triphosphohydrolase [Corynebacterium caspium]WKD58907.1 Deoxyguanosinetriphosphate triphosphohydrolase [Corynebacterium caspium DSM 44850]
MYAYNAADIARLAVEHPKKAAATDAAAQLEAQRSIFDRDRARVLHSAALRRLADKTQVVGPRDGDTPRTRLTHSLEVAQIARGIGAGLGLDPDLCELAGLTHDIGHPPYGHNGERTLNELAKTCGGFEGNAQTLRILTVLEPKFMVGEQSYGLNLSRAALDSACKYPWTATNSDGSKNRKYSCYDSDAHILEWVREGHEDLRPCIEAQVMDWADDVAYSVHDVEDGIVSGRISLQVLWDLVALLELANTGFKAFSGEPEELVAAADSLRGLEVVARAADFQGSLADHIALKRLTSELVGRYVGAVIEATKAATANNSGTVLGRQYGDLIVPPQLRAEVKLLKTIAVQYVMDEDTHLARQQRQSDRIVRVFDYLCAGAPGSLDPMFRYWWNLAETAAARERVVIDQIASMTESRLERFAEIAGEFFGFLSN